MKYLWGLVGLCFLGIAGCREKTAPVVRVDDTLHKEAKEMTELIEFKYAHFEELAGDPKTADAFRSYHEKASRLKKMTEWRTERIQRLKTGLLAEVDGISLEEAAKPGVQVKNPDDFETTGRYFGTDKPDNVKNGRAAALKTDIASYRDSLQSAYFLADPIDSLSLPYLDTRDHVDPDGKTTAWERVYFYRLPYPAMHTELTKWQHNLSAAESQMLDYLLNDYLKNNPGK